MSDALLRLRDRGLLYVAVLATLLMTCFVLTSAPARADEGDGTDGGQEITDVDDGWSDISEGEEPIDEFCSDDPDVTCDFGPNDTAKTVSVKTDLVPSKTYGPYTKTKAPSLKLKFDNIPGDVTFSYGICGGYPRPISFGVAANDKSTKTFATSYFQTGAQLCITAAARTTLKNVQFTFTY